jgi:hypothetical protein
MLVSPHVAESRRHRVLVWSLRGYPSTKLCDMSAVESNNFPDDDGSPGARWTCFSTAAGSCTAQPARSIAHEHGIKCRPCAFTGLITTPGRIFVAIRSINSRGNKTISLCWSMVALFPVAVDGFIGNMHGYKRGRGESSALLHERQQEASILSANVKDYSTGPSVGPRENPSHPCTRPVPCSKTTSFSCSSVP